MIATGRVRAVAVAAALLCIGCGDAHTSSPPTMQPATTSTTPDFSRGVNITRWFRFPEERTDAYFRDYITDADLALLEKHHFTVVRLNLAPDVIVSATDPGGVDRHKLEYVDMAARRINAHHMAVILDLHDEQRSFETVAGGERLETFWRTFASHYARSDPRWTAFELLNEPIFSGNAAGWDDLQRRLLADVRLVAPHHVIIATGADWGSVAGLAKLGSAGDDRTVYSVHFYDPFAFTHQGADWTPEYQPIAGLEFPPQPDNCAHVLANLGNPAHQSVQDYCDDPTQSNLAVAFRPALDWAMTHHRRLFVGEFGVYCLKAPRDGKLRWYDAVMPLLKTKVDGWAVWGYDDCFGLDRQVTSGRIQVDQDVLARLTG